MGRIMDRIIRKVGGLYILTQSPAGHKQKFEELKAEREEMYDNVDDVRKRFDQLFDGGYSGHDRDYVHQLSVWGMKERDDVLSYRYDVEGTNIPVFLDMVGGALQARMESQYQPALGYQTENFAGHIKEAEIIFVGDKTNSKMRAINWPFYDFGHCSEFFADALHELRFNEERAIYVNAHNHNGPLYVNDIVRKKPFIQVVCLGNQSYETMLRFNRNIKKVMHPSFAKRFNKRDEFMLELEGAIYG
jgi:hypothetical protein